MFFSPILLFKQVSVSRSFKYWDVMLTPDSAQTPSFPELVRPLPLGPPSSRHLQSHTLATWSPTKSVEMEALQGTRNPDTAEVGTMGTATPSASCYRPGHPQSEFPQRTGPGPWGGSAQVRR